MKALTREQKLRFIVLLASAEEAKHRKQRAILNLVLDRQVKAKMLEEIEIDVEAYQRERDNA